MSGIERRLPITLSKTRRAQVRRMRERTVTVINALRNDRVAMLGLGVISFFVFLAIFGQDIAPYDPETYFRAEDGRALRLHPPSLAHPLGTTHLGQDVFTHWLHGARVTVMVGFLAGTSVAFIGTNVGLAAGYYKGRIDNALMRITDIIYGIPVIPFVLVVALFLGASVWNIYVAMILVMWRTTARTIRAQTLSLSERPFVKSARAMGASNFRIMYVHILPNLLPLVFIETVIYISFGIIIEAGVSFLGAGAADAISYGTMLQMTFETGAIRSAWWWVVPPGLSITLIVISLFYISRAAESITNPELEGR